MKCSDIAEADFLAALEPNGQWTMAGAVAQRLGVPLKLVTAKARIMIDRHGTLHGCPCGCRGDFHRPDECQGC